MKATSLLQIKTSKKVVLTMELVITYDILMQGHSRRLLVQVKPVQNSGTLPIICESIQHVSIGCVCARSKLQKGLDRWGYFLECCKFKHVGFENHCQSSFHEINLQYFACLSYQEEDLARLREKWSSALDKRREYLDEQLQKIMNKEGEMIALGELNINFKKIGEILIRHYFYNEMIFFFCFPRENWSWRRERKEFDRSVGVFNRGTQRCSGTRCWDWYSRGSRWLDATFWNGTAYTSHFPWPEWCVHVPFLNFYLSQNVMRT